MGQPAIAYPFDTHATVKRLERKGFNLDQAEAIVEVHADTVANQMATKDDIAEILKQMEENKIMVLR